MNAYQTLLLDLLPGQGASATAAVRSLDLFLGVFSFEMQSNMFRCLLGAAVVAAVDSLRRALGDGWAFVLLGGLAMALTLPLLIISRHYGPRMRERRRLRKAAASSTTISQ